MMTPETPRAERFGIQPTTAPLSDHEADALEAATDCLEVIVKWGEEQVLQVSHVDLDGAFVVGAEGEVDFLAGAELLGTGRLALLEGGHLAVPTGAEVEVHRHGAVVEAAPTLGAGETCVVRKGELTFVVRRVRKACPTSAHRSQMLHATLSTGTPHYRTESARESRKNVGGVRT